mmetsp:Transcript_741/g.1704  ORF Transcript_741/g.1704 Transcript_741/m.1704 type:complete len:83 (-) Transcript_741:409-657(-)
MYLIRFDLLPFDDVPTLLKHEHTHAPHCIDHGTKTEKDAQEIDRVLIFYRSKQTMYGCMHACELQRIERGERQAHSAYYPSG